MVDLHSHILPGIDDGAKTFEESLAMCEMAYQDGIRTIVATPHIGKFPNTKEIISSKLEQLKKEMSNAKLDISLFCGADIEFNSDIFSSVDKKLVFTINNSRYLLLDIPYFLIPPNISCHISHLIDKGIVPIMTHPERCLQIQEDPSIIYGIIESGAIIQVTASSITGKMGPKAKDTAIFLLKHGLVQVIATDAHGLDKRLPVLSEALEIASKIISKDEASALVTTIPQAIIEDKPVVLPKPMKH